MSKILFWLAVGVALLLAARIAGRLGVRAQEYKTERERLRQAQQRASGQTKHDADARPMVACAHCGIRLPADEAVMRAGQPYCGESHADAGPRR